MKLSKLSALLYGGIQALTVQAQGPLRTRSSSPSNSSAPPYRDDLISLHKSLVEISSISENETTVGDFLISYLTEHNFVANRQFLPSSNTSRFNVIAWPDSRASNSSKVVVTSHIDVVPPYIPYSRTGPEPPTAETVIAGRGSVDAKASVAAQIFATLELVSDGTATGDDVMLVFVVGEERTGDGMKHFSNVTATQSDRPKAAIFGEPTEGRLACGHKGSLACEITAHGRSGHSGYPWLGKSATEVLMRGMIRAIDADFGSNEVFGNTTTNVGLLEGGIAVNVIPDIATAGVVIRVALGPELEGAETVRSRFVDLLTSVDDEAFDVECSGGYGAVECNCDVDGEFSLLQHTGIL